jgi:virulence-associated protein VagC
MEILQNENQLTIEPHANQLSIDEHKNKLTIAAHGNKLTLEAIDIYTYVSFIAPWAFTENHTEVNNG